MTTPRQRQFVALYLGKAKGNATLAATMAGYRWPGVAGPRLLTDGRIAVLVEARLDLLMADADECLARLSALARSSMGDFLRFAPGAEGDDIPALDLRKARRRGQLGSIRKLKRTARTIPRGDGPPETETTVELELHDPIKALALLAKFHGLDRPRAEVDAPTSSEGEYGALLARIYGAAAEG